MVKSTSRLKNAKYKQRRVHNVWTPDNYSKHG